LRTASMHHALDLSYVNLLVLCPTRATLFPYTTLFRSEKGYDDIRFEIGNPFVFGRKMTYASRRVGVFILKFFSTGECPRGISTGMGPKSRCIAGIAHIADI